MYMPSTNIHSTRTDFSRSKRLARCENIAAQVEALSKNAEAPFVVIALPSLVVVFKRKDRNARIVSTCAVQVEQCVVLVGNGGYCSAVAATTRRPARSRVPLNLAYSQGGEIGARVGRTL